MSQQHEQSDDGRLVRRALNGDPTAFGRLYDRHARRVRAVVSGAAEDASAVDDLTQECFLRAHRKLDRLHPQEHFGPWLLGIARRVAREKRRSLHRDRHRFVGTAPSGCQEPAAGQRAGPSPDELRDDLEIVLDRIGRLPESQRVAIELFFLEGCDAEKTAKLLGMSRSGTYALLKRACRRVARSIARESPVGE